MAKVNRRWWLLLLMPFCLCFGWIGINWAYEVWEIRQLVSLVDEQKLPGRVIARDALNDYPYTASNGALVRAQWIVQTEDPPALKAYAKALEQRFAEEAFRVDLSEINESGREQKLNPRPEKASVFVLHVSKGRGPLWWEIPD